MSFCVIASGLYFALGVHSLIILIFTMIGMSYRDNILFGFAFAVIGMIIGVVAFPYLATVGCVCSLG